MPKTTYRCEKGHESHYAISLADSDGMACPICKTNKPVIFSIERTPTQIDVEILEEIYECGGWHDAQQLSVRNFTFGLSVFDRPDKMRIQKTAEGLAYYFEYHNYIGNDLWWFAVSRADVALAKYAWQLKEKRDESPLFSQPMETIIRVVKGPAKADCVKACRSIALAAEKIHVRLNANLLAWLISQI